MDQTAGPTVSLQTSPSHGQTIVLSAQSKLFQFHVLNFKAHNRKCNTFLNILLLTVSADINTNPGPEVSLEQHSYDTTESLPTYYPFGCCTREVSWGDSAVNCDKCNKWCKLLPACIAVLHLGDRWYMWQPISPPSRWWISWSWPLPTTQTAPVYIIPYKATAKN